MFKNIGKKIKTLAVVIFIFELIGVFILGLITMIGGAAASSIMGSNGVGVAGVTGVFGGILIWIVGFLSSWIGSFFLYGFGELIDKTAENAQNTKRIADLMSMGQVMPSQPPVNVNIPQAPAPVRAPAPAPAPAFTGVICPSCGAKNESGSGFCVNCGSKLN